MSYDFTTLSPEDFELLVADLLSREFGSQLEVFKAGKDGGIDLRHSRLLPGQRAAIVQCKRYASYRYSALERAAAAEVPKIARLNPERYLLVTSVELSPQNKDSLLAILHPWCLGSQDILGAAEVLALLRKYPEVERAHFKLWISSTAVLERVVHSRIFNLTDATVESAKEQMSRLVVHAAFQRALDTLAEHHHVLIVGNPGIGKTTLARMLMCHYLQEDFEPIVVAGDISDVWAAVQASDVSESKQVVLYDDFLGQLRFDSVRFGKNEEMSLHEFLEKVRRSHRFRFILTTREYILADARRMHGAFERDADHMARCTVSLDDYTEDTRAKVLFNHLYFSALPESRLRKLVEKRVYQRIVRHKHFSPRIVEGISSYANSRAMSDEEYLTYIETEFDNPRAIWEHPFRYQISPTARQLLMLLWSFHGNAEIGELRESLLRLNAINPPEEIVLRWHDALRELDGNFISTNRYPLNRDPKNSATIATFQNPSVEEFVEGCLIQDQVWLNRLSEAIVSFKQVDKLLSHVSDARIVPFAQPTDDFWNRLELAARTLESKPSGALINYKRSQQSDITREWRDGERPSYSDRIGTRLAIAGRLRSNLSAIDEIRQRLKSPVTWRAALADIGMDDSVAYAVGRLVEQVKSATDLSADDSMEIGETFRSCLLESMEAHGNDWPLSAVSLLEVAEALVNLGIAFGDIERSKFQRAAEVAADTATEHFDDPGTLDSEADAIRKLGTLYGVDVGGLHDRLLESSAERQEEFYEREFDSNPEASSYSSGTSAESDIDDLFVDLLDR